LFKKLRSHFIGIKEGLQAFDKEKSRMVGNYSADSAMIAVTDSFKYGKMENWRLYFYSCLISKIKIK